MKLIFTAIMLTATMTGWVYLLVRYPMEGRVATIVLVIFGMMYGVLRLAKHHVKQYRIDRERIDLFDAAREADQIAGEDQNLAEMHWVTDGIKRETEQLFPINGVNMSRTTFATQKPDGSIGCIGSINNDSPDYVQEAARAYIARKAQEDEATIAYARDVQEAEDLNTAWIIQCAQEAENNQRQLGSGQRRLK